MPVVVEKLSGIMLFIVCVATIVIGYGWDISAFAPRALMAVLIAIPALVLTFRLAATQRFQVLILCVVAITLLSLSGSNVISALPQALTTNMGLISLIISVGFLRLIIHPHAESAALPTGQKSMWQTLIGLHFLSAVINLSAITIFADRMTRNHPLRPAQYMLLSRTFGADALWSPFFAAMGAAIAYSFGADFKTLLLAGFVSAIASMLITGWQCHRYSTQHGDTFESYPMSLGTLFLPLMLCVLVIVAHQIFPAVSILVLVAGVVLLSVIVMLIWLHGPIVCLQRLSDHIQNGIPRSATEILLFTSAGLLVVGFSQFYHSLDLIIPITHFGGLAASVSLLIMVLLACIGIHPLITISIAGELLKPLAPDPNLLGVLFLLSWGIALPISPLSGVNLTMQSRYAIRPADAFRYNTRFTVLMLVFGCIVLSVVSEYCRVQT